MVKKLLLGVVALIFAVSLAYVCSHTLSNSRTKKMLKEVSSEIIVPTEIKQNLNVTTNEGENDIGVSSFYVRDITSLVEEYPEVKAWLHYGPCDIDYPLTQCEDNEKYLSVGLDGNYSANGWVYFDYRNDLGEGDLAVNQNVIVYGHNMANGSMFGNLSDIIDKDYMSDSSNHYIYMNTLTRQYIFKIFAVYKSDLSFDFLQTSFDDTGITKYIQTAKSKTTEQGINIPYVNIHSNDVLLTLCTCTDLEDERLIVNAVLVESDMIDREEVTFTAVGVGTDN